MVSNLSRHNYRKWRAARLRVFDRDEGVCRWCGQAVDPTAYDVDHIIPRWMGGGDEDGNLVLSHPSCNRGRTPKRKPSLPRANIARW